MPHSVPEVWRVLSTAQDRRNLAECDGHIDVEERQVPDPLTATLQILAAPD